METKSGCVQEVRAPLNATHKCIVHQHAFLYTDQKHVSCPSHMTAEERVVGLTLVELVRFKLCECVTYEKIEIISGTKGMKYLLSVLITSG